MNVSEVFNATQPSIIEGTTVFKAAKVPPCPSGLSANELFELNKHLPVVASIAGIVPCLNIRTLLGDRPRYS